MEADVEIRHNGTADRLTGFGGLVALAFGAIIAWMCSQQSGMGPVWVAAGLIVLAGLGLIGYSASSLGSRYVRLTIGQEGLTDHRRGRLFRWAEVRRARLLISKPGSVLLGAVLELTVEENGGLRPRRINLMGLDHSPEKIADLVQGHVLPGLNTPAEAPQ